MDILKYVFLQGDHPSSILENLLKTAQVNLIKGSHSTVGSQFALTSNVYGRLGNTMRSDGNWYADGACRSYRSMLAFGASLYEYR